MAEKKQESFTVTDRRLFTSEGEVRKEASEEEVSPKPQATKAQQASKVQDSNLQDSKLEDPKLEDPKLGVSKLEDREMPPAPTAAEQRQQADEYRKSAKELDTRVELSGHSAKDLEMTFERFAASLYMTAMLQLGLMHEQGGEPRLDLIGARQTIDTLSLLSEKTKGNLTSAEENLLQNCLYELRMAYVEVTNALARPAQATGTNPAKR
jgi:hypothetical protein